MFQIPISEIGGERPKIVQNPEEGAKLSRVPGVRREKLNFTGPASPTLYNLMGSPLSSFVGFSKLRSPLQINMAAVRDLYCDTGK